MSSQFIACLSVAFIRNSGVSSTRLFSQVTALNTKVDTIANAGEWLETDGKGSFAMGRADGIPSRRYHSLLTLALGSPSNRLTILNAVECFATVDDTVYPLSSFRFAPDFIHPKGVDFLTAFSAFPWPCWRFTLPDGTEIVQEFFLSRGETRAVLSWKASRQVTLSVRPLFSFRHYHGEQRYDPSWSIAPRKEGELMVWEPFYNAPQIAVLASGPFHSEPLWYYNFFYREEESRGYNSIEDLASGGTFQLECGRKAACLIVAPRHVLVGEQDARALLQRCAQDEKTRRRDETTKAVDDFLVERERGLTLIAGYPWFTDWGRDTCISVRGLCISTGRFAEAARILTQWACAEKDGMIPNLYPDHDNPPLYNAVDASLWFVIAVHDLLTATAKSRKLDLDRKLLLSAVKNIIEAHLHGTRYQIKCDELGLLACGEPGVQLTWMDAKIGNYVVTPRTGKPVEIQALWLNTLLVAAQHIPANAKAWERLAAKGKENFAEYFWNKNDACLYDVIDCDHEPGRIDAKIRPNQILAVGGLPFPILPIDKALAVVNCVERLLVTPHGLRTLAANERGYSPHYEGSQGKRDLAYHQGTVWPWLMGSFVEAFIRVHGKQSRAEALRRFVAPLAAARFPAAGAHLAEVADGDAPHTFHGTPFQAWSLGELLRAQALC